MSGIRFQRAFGDTVNWDLIPNKRLIEAADLWTIQPSLRRINALGGAVNLTMKNWLFTYQGVKVRSGRFICNGMGERTGSVKIRRNATIRDTHRRLFRLFRAPGFAGGRLALQSPANITRLICGFGWRSKRGGTQSDTLRERCPRRGGCVDAQSAALIRISGRSSTTPQTTTTDGASEL